MRRAAVDATSLLLAVERVGADVAALGRALATQPEEVAARVDVDAATASINVRVGALGSALDQFRLSLLAALDRTAERLIEPAWLPELRRVVAEREPQLDEPAWLPSLRAELAARPLDGLRGSATVLEAIDALALDRRLDELATTLALVAGRHDATGPATAADADDRLTRLEQAVRDLSDGVRAGGAIADALDHLGERLGSIEGAAGRVAEDARTLVDQVGPVPDRLSAIASQIDRISPLARAGDQAGSLFAQLDRFRAGQDEIVALLRSSSEWSAKAGTGGEDERLAEIGEALDGVIRRQDNVTTAIAAVLDQVRGPKGADAVLERMEQRERSLAARLDRIEATLRRSEPGAAVQAGPDPAVETTRALDAIVARVEQQERLLGFRLDQIDSELRWVREATAAAADAQDRPDRLLGSVLERVQQQEATVARHLDWVGERLAEVATHLVPVEPSPTAAADDQHDQDGDDERFVALGQILEAVARRQDELATAISSLADQGRGPAAVEAVFDRMEQRERSLAARLDRIDLQLRGRADEAPLPARGPWADEPRVDDDAVAVLGASVQGIAAVTESLAALVESTTDRLDRRLARVEAGLDDAATKPRATTRSVSSGAAAAAARRLIELRAERAEIQARLEEERLLAAEAWDEEL